MKKRIVIASVLKPVDDIRAYEKIAQSIAKTNKYEVNIIGNKGKSESNDKRITFHSHQLSSNSFLKRLLTRKKIFLKIRSLKPQLLVITTHELLVIALAVKLFIGCEIIYDVQENYVLNIKYITPTFYRKFYSKIIRLKESLSKIYVSNYWLAEACYADQLRYVKNKYTIIENKAIKLDKKRVKTNKIKLLFSGTISNYGGVKNAIHLFKKIQKNYPTTTLKIIGQIHDPKLEKYLQKIQADTLNFELQISRDYIDHNLILDAIFSSNLGIIGYEENEVNREKIPTKLYEYSQYQLPYVVAENTHWSKVGNQLGGSIPINFKNPNEDKIINSIKKPSLLFTKIYPAEATWEYESVKIINSINSLLI